MDPRFKERILKTYQHQPIDKIVWQPRIMYYYNRHNISQLTKEKYLANPETQKFVAESFIGKDIFAFYDEIDASIRYPAETLSMPLFYREKIPDTKIVTNTLLHANGEAIQEEITPVGKVQHMSRNGYPVEHIVKKLEDLKAAEYIATHTALKFNPMMFEAAEEALENYGIPTSYYFRSPYQSCVLEYLGFETTVKFLRRYPREMEQFMTTLAAWDAQQYKDTILKTPIKLLNFGENIDCELDSPPIVKKYLLPYYEERVKWIHAANKFCFIHIDGSLQDLLPLLSQFPHDGLEALTPEPQGDVTIKQIADAIGDKILVDGIPATVFMPEFPEQRLRDCVQELLERISPHLILGVSDELPPNADGRRLKIVAELVNKFKP